MKEFGCFKAIRRAIRRLASLERICAEHIHGRVNVLPAQDSGVGVRFGRRKRGRRQCEKQEKVPPKGGLLPMSPTVDETIPGGHSLWGLPDLLYTACALREERSNHYCRRYFLKRMVWDPDAGVRAFHL